MTWTLDLAGLDGILDEASPTTNAWGGIGVLQGYKFRNSIQSR